VLLHGDGENAASMLDAWERSAAARGMAVLALACPKLEGCTTRSWWQWDGDPSWLVRQTRALGELHAIDPERMWIVGWSGGASYVGLRTQEIEKTFAAIVLHGGGIPPELSTCPAAKAAVYFLVGDRNPLHNLAMQLREHYAACDDDVTWTLLKGADHDGERRALTAHREAILDWLSTRRLAQSPVSGRALPVDAEGPAPAPPATAVPAHSESAAPPASSTIPPPAPTPCRCSCPGIAPSTGGPAALSPPLVAAALARRRRRRLTDARR